MNLVNLDKKIKGFEEETFQLKGRLDTLDENFVKTQEKLCSLKEQKIINKKAVELLNIVQKATKELIQKSFEGITTDALQFIHQDSNYKFELEFGKRGNTPELNFNIKTPDMKEGHDIIMTRGGGTSDIVSLALRFVLLEISKTNGFVFFDEPFKHLDNAETEKKAIEFIKEIQKNTNRQFFLITHKDSIVNEIENSIIIK